MTDHPTLAEQIDAVEWAWAHVRDTGKRSKMRESEIEETKRRLEAAIETLHTMEYGREVLK